MKPISITEDMREALKYHLGKGWELKTGESNEKLSWIRKARTQIIMLDPAVENAPMGILRRAYRDLAKHLHEVAGENDVMMYDHKIAERFRSALATMEAVNDCIEMAPEAVMGAAQTVNPYFFDLPDVRGENMVFVLMPFTEPWSNRIWRDHLKPLVERVDSSPRLVCKRADDLYGADVLLDIVSAIRSARIVIADITGRNANVFYELGIAHCDGKRVILLAQDVDDIPFDLLRFRHIIYQDNSDGYRALGRGLKGAILEIIA